jgi:ATP-binding protein involved in chromosome partitioning
MAGITKDQVMAALRTVQDPELHKDLVTLNMVKQVDVSDGRVRIGVELTTPACPLKDQIRGDVERAVKAAGDVDAVEIDFTAQVRENPMAQSALPGVKNIIAVGAGKGGVGKSTVAVMLAVGLQRSGATVGLLDADVYGPSIPKLLNIEGERPSLTPDPQGRQDAEGKPLHLMNPIEAAGVRTISIGNIIPPGEAMIVRGPIVHGTIKQFLSQTHWGELDYLIVDLPPGTGDVALTLAQSVPLTGAVIVCTPQDLALIDATKAVKMYQKLNIPILGVVENMSYYICPNCNHRDEIFSHGGAEAAAKELDVPFLGGIPLNAEIRVHGDSGDPEFTFTQGNEGVRDAVQSVVEAMAGQVSVKNMLQVAQPTLSIE